MCHHSTENITCLWSLALILLLHTHNNTDGNQLVIFFSIVLYGDTYIYTIVVYME